MNESDSPRVVVCPLWDVKNRRLMRRHYHAWTRKCLRCGMEVVVARPLKNQEDAGEMRFICEPCALLGSNGEAGSVKVHRSECEEALRLNAERARHFSEHLQSKDDLAMTSKRDPEYQQKLREFRDARGRLTNSRRRMDAHTEEHGCR